MDKTSTLISESGLAASRKIVLSALVRLLAASATGILSVDTIARAAGSPVRTVHRALNDLQDLGLVGRKAGRRDGRRDGVIRAASVFSIDLGSLRASLRATREMIRERLDQAYALMSMRRAKLMQQRSAILARSNETPSNSSLLWAALSQTRAGSDQFLTVAAAMIAAGLGNSIADFDGFAQS